MARVSQSDLQSFECFLEGYGSAAIVGEGSCKGEDIDDLESGSATCIELNIHDLSARAQIVALFA